MLMGGIALVVGDRCGGGAGQRDGVLPDNGRVALLYRARHINDRQHAGEPAPDQNQLSIGSALARYYGELARREPILKPVQEGLQLPFPWQVVSDRMLATSVVPSANLLEIYITDSNPERAAWTANAIGEQLITFSPTSPEKIQAEQQAVDQQLQASDAKINDLQQQIADLTEQQSQATSASDLAELNQKLTQLGNSLAQEQSSYKSLLNYKSNSVVNSLGFFERAVPPNESTAVEAQGADRQRWRWPGHCWRCWRFIY